MPNYKNFARGIDFYHGHNIDWDIVMPHIDFGIAKTSESTGFKDPDFTATVEVFYKWDKPLLGFHWYDGKYYPSLQFGFDDKFWIPADRDEQLKNLIESIKFRKIYGLAVDLEEFSNENVMPSWMAKGAKVFTGRVDDYLRANKPYTKTLVYSRQTYINEFAPDINNWIHNYDTWVAQWWWANSTTEYLTWEEFERTIPPDTARVGHLGASETWKFWQYAGGRFIFPGVYNNQNKPRGVDLNLFNGTVEELYSYLGFVPGQNVPLPEKDKYVPLYNLRYRTRPSLSAPVRGFLLAGKAVEIVETTITNENDGYTYEWGKLLTGDWSAIRKYKATDYMKKI